MGARPALEQVRRKDAQYYQRTFREPSRRRGDVGEYQGEETVRRALPRVRIALLFSLPDMKLIPVGTTSG